MGGRSWLTQLRTNGDHGRGGRVSYFSAGAERSDFAWLMMGTQSLALCCQAVAEYRGEAEEEVRQFIDTNAASRRETPEIVTLRKRVAELEAVLSGRPPTSYERQLSDRELHAHLMFSTCCTVRSSANRSRSRAWKKRSRRCIGGPMSDPLECPICFAVGRSICAVGCWPELVARYHLACSTSTALCEQLQLVEDAVNQADECHVDEDDETITIHAEAWHRILEAIVS